MRLTFKFKKVNSILILIKNQKFLLENINLMAVLAFLL